ncbi:TonB-dependent receptor [Lacinutrix sp. C3R15]|uniref:TonB-dependent receptor n=1 Tax=Flavobacteriaceae TaxID=49546 RepID=UPI001C085AB5|nr:MULTISPECIES: carboxypeptidase-like regulatory domain-containing protein [Flavobacteriaceae]MBU2940888.1 TonB-dependent receptor [Lacinutrix sp. C3R15]MDO6624207.1 carboxypeptidase-like regulatory domain-containing protein [Oceanihabitans sp. 1_MG-2023]
MKKISRFLFLVVAFVTTGAMAQSTVTGTIIDAEMNAPLPAANIIEKGTANGASSDFDGNFTITTQANSGEVVISYVGYTPVTLKFNGNTNLGSITLASDNSLEEVVVMGSGVIDLAEDRKTPVAVSTIKAAEIQQKIGTQDVTATLVNTPSVYVSGQAGGFGDTNMRVRGFDQDNTAFLLNGQPINGMEDGKMYWSNWSGISDIANAVQIQRGLGSSKLAISSVGGTVNFVTKSTEKREGGFAAVSTGYNNYLKTAAGYSTGTNDKGFGATVMLSHWQGDGYNFGTKGEGQTYFISFGYKVNDKHSLNFLVTGAPQQHDQNYRKSISDYLEHGKKYNYNYGYRNGEYLSLRTNFYHKPVANLNWDWTINEKSSLSTVVYASWGRGGGTGGYGAYTASTEDGLVDWDATIAANEEVAGGIGNGSGPYVGTAIRASMNNHAWYGLVSNYENQLSDNLSLNFGADLRTYKGTHFRQIVDLLGLNGIEEGQTSAQYPDSYIVSSTNSINPWSTVFNYADEDERIDYDYDERINYAGVFGQLEYAKNNFSAFFQGAVSTQSHVRWDRFNYVEADEESETVNNTGFNIKAGGSYSIGENSKIYVNGGYYSRQPYHDNIYLNYTNEVNPLTENEKILGLEVGYSYTSSVFSAALDVYRTNWKDRVESSSYTDGDTNELFYRTNEGVEQLHTGAELQLQVKPINSLRIKGFASVGNWEYVGDAQTTTRNENLETLSVEMEDVDGGEVGGAAQTTFGLGADFEIVERFSIDADYRHYDKLYADVGAIKENLELPSYGLMDMGLSYKMLVGKDKSNSVNFRFNINNLLDEEYFSQSSTAIQAEAGDATYLGINQSNQVYFGNGRTWNFGIRYKF